MRRRTRIKLLNIIVLFSIIAGSMLISWGLTVALYKPTDCEVNQVVRDYEKARQRQLYYYRDADGKWKRIEKEARKDGK